MSQSENLKQVVGVFAQYGFRKTSMRDLADGLGISRQALYNRFSSKEEVFDWAARTLVEESAAASIAKLEEEGPLADRLAEAIHLWVGQYVDLMKSSPHSAEVVQMVGDASSDMADDASRKVRDAIAAAIAKASHSATKDRAEDLAYSIYMGSKGLLGAVESSAGHDAGIRRIIGAFGIES